MPYQVDALVQAMEAPIRQAVRDRAARQASHAQLLGRDHASLSRRNLGYRYVRTGLAVICI
jgi:hypothetical protein